LKKEMASRRLDVGQGAIAWFVTGSLLLASACSGDSNVSFGEGPLANSDAGSGGARPASSGSGSGAEQSGGGSDAQSGSGQGGKGNGTSGKGNAGDTSAGTASAGMASTAGSNTSGNAGAAGSSAGSGGAGTAGTSGTGGDDECTTASYGNHSYAFCGPVDTALLAAAKCQSLGMSMVSIESQLENAFVLGKQKGSSWLGGADQLAEGTWIWAATGVTFWDGGSPLSGGKAIDGVYQDFILLQPNDNGADGAHENCIVLTASGWNDLVCTIPDFRAACEESP